MDFYLDHNIYIYSLIDKSIVSAVDLLKKSVNFFIAQPILKKFIRH